MKIAVWRTGHEIADTVAEAVYEGLSNCRLYDTREHFFDQSAFENEAHISYGILRGSTEVFHKAQALGRPWFNIDKGYWQPGHYDGYYRISLRGTQQTFGLDKLKPDYERWDALGLEILPPKYNGGHFLFCPATEAVKGFFSPINYPTIATVSDGHKYRYRDKNCDRSLEDDLTNCRSVITFNSSVGWEALRQGILVVSDPTHSIVGSFQKILDKSIHDDSNARRDLFALMASLQLSLSEIRGGLLWPKLQELLTIS